MWITGGTTLERRDACGELLRRIAMDTWRVLGVAAAPDGDMLVWRQPDPFTSELVRHAADGAARWSVKTPQSGHLYRHEMACDDVGTTYISAAGRFGDGVSGNDRPSGGVAIVSRDGTLVPAPALPGRPWDHGGFCAAREASAVVGVCTQVEVDGQGRILRQLEVRGDDPAVVPWDGYRMKLTARSQVLDPSLVLGFYASATQQMQAVVDAEGVRYFELARRLRYDDLPSDPPAIVAVDAEDRCLFRIPTASIGVDVSTALAIGPEGTLLVVHRDGLTAIA